MSFQSHSSYSNIIGVVDNEFRSVRRNANLLSKLNLAKQNTSLPESSNYTRLQIGDT